MIRLLSPQLISQIAAGEVIERPASALKELVENSLDAGADQIQIEIEEGGLKQIRVMDNGTGIPQAEAPLAFERHATSKIAVLEDLFNIHSLGFRGEALASIASVARVVLHTRHADERIGTLLEMDGGKLLKQEPYAMDHGTDLRIFGLFHHTPARKKYMKSERTEYGHCFDFLVEFALAHPEVGFRLSRDGDLTLDLPRGQSTEDRIRSLFGKETAKALLPVNYLQSNLLIRGYVGKPELARSGKKYQFLFINGRAVQHRLIHHAVKEAFHSLLMHEKHPWFLLDIQMDPALVDVNVHPRKLEVRFVNQSEMYGAVHGAVKHALEAALLAPVQGQTLGYSMPLATASYGDLQPSMNFSFPSAEGLTHTPAPSTPSSTYVVQGQSLRPVAQIAHSYIVAESEEGLVLIDQHAAHERVRYAQLMEALEKAPLVQQPLLTPLELDLGADGARILSEYAQDFADLGFDIEAFGGNHFILRAVPAGLERRKPEALIQEILADVEQEWKQNHPKNLREILLTSTACRGAVKFGDPLTLLEMQALLMDMEKTKHCSHCPHGRPAMLTFTFDHLETLFKRKNF